MEELNNELNTDAVEEFSDAAETIAEASEAEGIVEEADEVTGEAVKNMNNNYSEVARSYEELDPKAAKKAAKLAKKEAKKDKVTFGKVLATLVLTILLGALAGSAFYGMNLILYNTIGNPADVSKNKVINNNKTPGKVDDDVDVSKLENQLTTPGADSEKQPVAQGSVAKIAEEQLASVVAITNLGVSQVQTLWGTYNQESQSAGSGVIIGKTDKEVIILTNYHVVSGYKELTVVFSFDESSDEEEKKASAVPANVKGYDAERDVAVIAIQNSSISDETMKKIKVAVVGDSDALKLGEQVVAIGNALGYGQSVTTGIVSAINRHMELDGTDGTKISNDYIQTDAAINPGNSGGAMYNMNGELVGVNSAKVGGSQVEGMGYAIPMNAIKDLVTKLMNKETLVTLTEEEQGYLGVGGQDVDANSALYGVPSGVYVSAVGKGSAADKAGIEKKDIINEINGETISSMNEMKQLLSYCRGGEKITVKIYRFDSERRIYDEKVLDVTLDDYKTFKKISDSMK